MIWLVGLVYGLVGAGLFRLRGSSHFEAWTGRGKTTADAVWALGLSLPLPLFGLPWAWVPAMLVVLWLGGRLPWWKSIDMGRNPLDGTTPAQDWLMQSLRGVLWVAGAAAVVWWLGGAWWLVVVAGLSCSVCYEIGWRVNPDFRYSVEATEIGEVVFGFVIAAALAYSVVEIA